MNTERDSKITKPDPTVASIQKFSINYVSSKTIFSHKS